MRGKINAQAGRLKALIFAALAVGVMLGAAPPASAWFDLCNKSSEPVYAAFGYNDGNAWVSEGWWNLAPGECATVYDGSLTQRKYYAYAESHSEEWYWDGEYPFCAQDDVFTIVGDTNCKERGFYEIDFFEIDVGEAPNYTFDLID